MGLLVKRRVTLDLARRGTQATVPFSLGDRCAYEVIFTLRDGSEQVALPPDTSAAVTVRNGAGGTGCVDGCVIDHVNNNVIYTPTVDALSVEGNIECTLHLFDGDGGVIGAPTFIFAVSEGDKADTEGEVSKALVANPGWGIIADTENKAKEAAEAAAAANNFASQASDEVAAAQTAAGEARDEADRAHDEAELSKMWANGGITLDEPPSEINNSYYWAMMSATERISAETQVGLAAAEVNNARTEVQNAAAEVEKAKAEAQTAEAEAIKARMWAVGEKNTPGKTSPSDSNNAMYYSNKSRDYMNEAEKYTNMTLSLSVDREKHIYTVSLIRDGTVIGNPIEIDLPFEEVVVGGEYDDTYEELVLKLKDGASVRIPVGDIISPDDVVRRQYSGSYDAVYTETSSGEVVLLPVKVYSGDGAANTLVKRGSLGEIRVRLTPESDNEAVSKKYVDEIEAAIGNDIRDNVIPKLYDMEQQIGHSREKVMSQNAVTEELSKFIPTVQDYSVQNVVRQTRLIGKGKYISTIIQTEEAESTVLVQYNGGTVEHLKLSNTNGYPNKIAIDVIYPAQHLCFNDIIINDNYAMGVRLPTGFYSQFNSCWVQGDIGIAIGKEDGSGWIGVLDFNACHFNNSIEAFKVYAKDTNTICLDKCSFEGSDLSIDNAGTLYVRNTYFGDQLNTGNKHGVLIARAGSKTYFDNCTIGVSIFADGGEESLFDLRSDEDGRHSIVFVTGGVLNISNDTVHKSSPNAIYATDSPDNLIYIDFATFTPSKINKNHNYIPFKIYDGFSPLRSRFPLRNYVCNGTMKSELGNAMMLSHSSANGLVFDDAMTNPFGGSVLRANGTAKFFYKIPKHFVGQTMTLEFYMHASNPEGLKLSSKGLGGVYWSDTIQVNEDERRPIMYRIDVTPTAEAGCIEFNHSDSFNVYGVILKEHRYKEFLSCYEDSGELYCDEAPRITDGATLGDIVGNIDLSSSGWKYTNGKWTPVFDTVTYSIEFSDGMAHIVGSDGTVKFLATTDTEAAEITLNLINCISSNGNKFTPEGRGYDTTLTTSENYAISSVVVTIDGTDVTNTVYNSETKTVTIPTVNGNIVITAKARYEVVPDIAASHLCGWAFNKTTENFKIVASNTEFALGILVRTKEDVANNGLAEEDILNEGVFVCKDRFGNYLRPIPVPEEATKVTVEHTDGIAYKYTFVGVKGDTEDSKDITVLCGDQVKVEYNYATFAAGEYDYILITCTRADGSNIEWNSSTEITTTTVIFSKAEEI